MPELLKRRAIGTDQVRRDAYAKVTGTAPYAYEVDLGETPLAYVHPIQATIAAGRVASIETTRAANLPGVLAVLTTRDAEELASDVDPELAVLQSDEVAFRGQLIGAVIAETSEVARHAQGLVEVRYDVVPHDVRLAADREDLYRPDSVNGGFATDTGEGDVAAAVAAADVHLQQTYTTAMNHNNPMEPHTTTALWASADRDAAGRDSAGTLTLWDSTQGVHTVRQQVAAVFGLGLEQVRVICPYMGGGFGSKGTVHAQVVLAALAARAVPGRAVKLALTRQQMFFLAGYRTPTIQQVQLAADRDGSLRAVAIDVVEQTATVKEFAEQVGVPASTMYAAEARRSTHRLAALNVPVPSWMRAPGVCPGMFGPEVAMDELADKLGIDPIELRIRNEPDVDPATGKPFSSRNLIACMREGADRFGWSERDRLQRQGDWLVGMGMSASTYPVDRQSQSTAAIRFEAGRYVVAIGAADLGTGTWTTLPQIAADALDVALDDVEVAIGDTDYPVASVAGGSSGMTTWGTAVVEAARAFRDQFGDHPSDGDSADGSVQENPHLEHYAMHAFGAQFVEAKVNVHTGEVRLPRVIGVFAAGQIINPRTARSQFIGGMTMGLSMALEEQSVFDGRIGQVVNHDLAAYHVAVNADIGALEAYWIDEHDPHVNPMGSKGIGEIGIVGTAAAVVNAVHHATGVRVRDLPVTLDKLLPALPPVG